MQAYAIVKISLSVAPPFLHSSPVIFVLWGKGVVTQNAGFASSCRPRIQPIINAINELGI